MADILDNLDQPVESAPAEEIQQEVQEMVETPQPAPVEPPKEDIQDRNWKAARQRMEEQARQLDLLQRELDLVRRTSEAPKVKEPDEDEFLTESEKKLNQKIKAL